MTEQQKITTGGNAFPEVVTEYNQDREEYEVESTGGMTLRDYFAAKAMQAIFSWEDIRITGAVKITAESAYQMADAMIAARGHQ